MEDSSCNRYLAACATALWMLLLLVLTTKVEISLGFCLSLLLYLLVSFILGGWFHGVSVSPLRGVGDIGRTWSGEGVEVASNTLNRESACALPFRMRSGGVAHAVRYTSTNTKTQG
jgi:hypothetical protein